MSVTLNIENRIAVINFDRPDAKVNLLTFEVMESLGRLIDEVAAKSDLQALVITSSKPGVFIAGADIKEIEAIANSASATKQGGPANVCGGDGKKKAQMGQAIFNKLEDLKIPTVAVIDGVALGGGCELALACRYRVATFNEKVKIGLPEVNLGILPGFGGTYRMPRVVGLMEGLKMILAGKVIDSKRAYKIGLVDALVPSAGIENSVREFVHGVIGKPKPPMRRRKPRGMMEAFLDMTLLGHAIVYQQSSKNLLAKTHGFYPAPEKALQVIYKMNSCQRERALEMEAEAFSKLAVTDVCKNLIQVFYLSEKYKKVMPPECANLRPRRIAKCGVIGAGVMGGGIAQLLSYRKIGVRMKDINWKAVAQGLAAANKVFGQAVKKRKITKAEQKMGMSRISGTVDNSGLSNVDAVIEAVVEDMGVKTKVFAELGSVVPADALLCTNTSALSVAGMAAAVKNPERVIGFHFFNPVHRMPLVEIITHPATSPQTLADALGLAKTLGKTVVVVKDGPGFLVNRILLGYINEAGRILEEGASLEWVDKIMTDFGMPMGPFILSDEVGLDVGVKVLHILEAGLGERFKPVDIFEKVVAKGLLGKKSGKGFYIHPKGKKPRVPNPMIKGLCKSKGRAQFSYEEFQDRMVLVMVNEAARCLGDGIVAEPSDVDVGMIMGTGFPPFRGGLLRDADRRGIGEVVDALNRLADKFKSDRFVPCPYLMELKNNNRSFYS